MSDAADLVPVPRRGWPLSRSRRPDGTLARDAPGYRRFMPALMPRRNDSAVYFDLRVDIEETERFLAAMRDTYQELHPTVFHVVLWALARAFDRHPRLNRFVAGGRLYQRDGIWFTFTAKTAITEAGTLLEVKHRFDPDQPFIELVRDLQDAVERARAGARGLADRELDVFVRLPPSLRRGVVRLASAANSMNLLTRSFITGDPFFASAFLTNLGSVGLDAAFHHLYEYGTIPLFCTLGEIHDDVMVRDGAAVVTRVVSVKFAFDERVEDGLYAANALRDFRRLVEHPERELTS